MLYAECVDIAVGYAHDVAIEETVELSVITINVKRILRLLSVCRCREK